MKAQRFRSAATRQKMMRKKNKPWVLWMQWSRPIFGRNPWWYRFGRYRTKEIAEIAAENDRRKWTWMQNCYCVRHDSEGKPR